MIRENPIDVNLILAGVLDEIGEKKYNKGNATGG